MVGLAGLARFHWLARVSVALRLVAAGVLVLVSGGAAWQLHASRIAIVAQAGQQIARLNALVAEATRRQVETVDMLVADTLEMVQAMASQDGRALDDGLRQRIEGVRSVAALMVADEAGRWIAASASGLADAPAAAMLDSYRADPAKTVLITPPFRARDGRWLALLSRPMRGADGRLAGLVAGAIALGDLAEIYRSAGLNATGTISLRSRDGTLLAEGPRSEASTGAHPAITATRVVQPYPLEVVVSIDPEAVLEPWRGTMVRLITIPAVVAGAIMVGLIAALSERFRQVECLLEQSCTARGVLERTRDQLLRQIHEREKAEAALRQAHRIEAIGGLTAAFAHEFNNLLTVVLGNIDMLQRRFNGAAAGGLAGTQLMAIRAAAERGATLTRHLLAFARRQPLLPKVVDLNDVIRRMGAVLDTALAGQARLVLRLLADPATALVDQAQIERLVLNLVVNAREAMPHGGIVTIETDNHRVTVVEGPDRAPPGDYVRLIVRDTGVGMSPEIAARAFEPFFTTRSAHGASGLGLSQVFGTARQSGGEARIESALGQGTTVIVDLPRPALVPAQPAPWCDQYCNATVLLVAEDDQMRRETAAELRRIGCGVREAASARAALDILQDDVGVDVLLADLATAGMDSGCLAVPARALHPGLVVVFICASDTQMADPAVPGEVRLRAPLAKGALHKAIETALGQSAIHARPLAAASRPAVSATQTV